jgi:hypothetical protein
MANFMTWFRVIELRPPIKMVPQPVTRWRGEAAVRDAMPETKTAPHRSVATNAGLLWTTQESLVGVESTMADLQSKMHLPDHVTIL